MESVPKCAELNSQKGKKQNVIDHMLDQTYIITKDDLAIHFEQVVHKKKFQFSVLKLAKKKVFRELF